MRSLQLEAGDQLGLDCDLEQNRMAEHADERLAASLDFLRGDRAGRRQTHRGSVRTERCPGGLGELRQPGRDPVDKGGDARLARQPVEQIAGDVDGEPSRSILGGLSLVPPLGFDLGFRGGAEFFASAWAAARSADFAVAASASAAFSASLRCAARRAASAAAWSRSLSAAALAACASTSSLPADCCRAAIASTTGRL
jgi:hypothetical protein